MNQRISVQLPTANNLLFWQLTGHEALSEPFSFNLTLLGEDARLDRSKLLGQPVTLTLPTQSLTTSRYLNGKVTRAGVRPVELSGTRYAAYTLTVESDLWPMKRDRNMRIFQGQTVPEIVKTLFSEYQVNVDDQLTGNYRVWDYCVQYQESSFEFVSRLMELEGISYYFRHQADRHMLVLNDADSKHETFPGYESIPYHSTTSGGVTDEEGISQWAMEDSVTPGKLSLEDYDFRQPNAWLFQARQNPASPNPGDIDVYEWPGRFTQHSHGEKYARIRQERWQVDHQQIGGSATATGIAPGFVFTLRNAPFTGDNGDYLVTTAEYDFRENPYSSSDAGEIMHRIDFSVIPASTPYRPEVKTPWPRTYGPQTANVVGPLGESIWTDRYGRVKVKFHWDRQSKGDDTSSCWVRVSSAWAGQGFGGVQIPRIGDEVVVDFINGDPDRPIITGRVYNESSMPPWELPAAATVMGFMTRSKDGNKDNASYLFFEDKPGSEKVDLHAEKDMVVSVENDQTVTIDGHRNTTIKKTQTDDVTEDATFTYQAKRTTTVMKAETKTFNESETTTIQHGRKLDITSGGDNVTIKDGRTTNITGTELHHVTGNVTQNFDSALITTVKGGQTETIDGGVTINVNSGSWTQNVNNGTITITSPQTITLRSGVSIDLDAPKSTYTVGGHKEAVTGNSLSVTGASEGVTGVAFDYKALSIGVANTAISRNVISISSKAFEKKNVPLDYKQVGVLLESGALRWSSKALTLIV
ncbi:type VI secretion system tip protein VgrG [Kosakonia quasisacchari]|uniref:Type VI secretion system tip protein VgrG n=1 Tax=Kosakonia quasisacchari TaxID=2529380 RepID=A0A4R0HED2_9ENTR|nr:type VI secretion system tip protein TssI/VgrG [Kosakonia quasisacchari]TCC09517.1 type VI secretion system tip protein VgrG [Kosakonia quasisacchari]